MLRNASASSIPPDLLEHLNYIELYTSRVVRSALMGDYRSRVRGHGFDFDQHKKYQQGDDFRQIDWNVFARMEEVFVKRKFEDKELNSVIVADVSASMEFTTTAISKKELLLHLAATLAFSAAAENIGVGLLAFTNCVEEYIAPGKGRKQAWKIVERLWNLRPEQRGTDHAAPLAFLNSKLKKSCLLFCLSDFAGERSMFESPFLKMIVKKHDFVPIVVEDRLESRLPAASGFVRLRDMEHRHETVVRFSGRDRQKHDLKAEERRRGLQQSFYSLGLDHLWLRPDQPYLNPVLEFFLNRKRRR